MKTIKCVRFLLISDLHFTPDDRFTIEHGGIHNSLSKAINGKYLDGILITGDIVDNGAETDQFDIAKKFLISIFNDFSDKESEYVINNKLKSIVVVPGNHDVNWKESIDPVKRFSNYMKFAEDFTTPVIREGNRVSIGNLILPIEKSNTSIQILGTISPMLSGIGSDEVKEFLRGLFHRRSKEEEIKKIINELLSLASNEDICLDIAAITGYQLHAISETISKNSLGNEDSIKIILTHHNLLPHTATEHEAYDTVIDAGNSLRSMASNNINLILCGHKHQRDSSHFRITPEENSIDIFVSGHFLKDDGTFSILDIYPQGYPYYAKITTYKTTTFEPIYNKPITNFYYQDKIEPYLFYASRQNKKIFTIFDNMAKSLFSNEVRSKIIDDGLEIFDYYINNYIINKAYNNSHELNSGKIILSRENSAEEWKNFLKLLANKNIKEVRMMSLDDLEFWDQAIKGSKAAIDYCDPLHKEIENKTRILLLHKKTINSKIKLLIKIINWMNKGKIKTYVYAYDKDYKLSSQQYDFQIFGNHCVSRWRDMSIHEDNMRELVEDFSKLEVKNCNNIWKEIVNKCQWPNDKQQSYFDKEIALDDLKSSIGL